MKISYILPILCITQTAVLAQGTSPYDVPLRFPIKSLKAKASDKAITFSEFAINTSISNQYSDYGILFAGDNPFITNDGANPTSPVLSDSPRFNGSIEGKFVDPSDGKTPVVVQSFSLDAGYFDASGSTRIEWFDDKNKKLGQRANSQTGIENFTIEGGNIARWKISIFQDEPAGYAIDNVSIAPVQASILFRETKEAEEDGSWGFGNDEIPGWDHVGFQIDNLVYESHPGYVNEGTTGTFISDDGKESALITYINGVQAQHTKATFKHESTTEISPMKEFEEIPIERSLAEKMKQAIETKIGKATFAFIDFSFLGLQKTLAPEVQKGKNNTFTCVGLVEWSAEQAGKNEGQGFIPNDFEKIVIKPSVFLPALAEIPTLSPQLLNYFMKPSNISKDAKNIANDIKQWFQGLLDPVDFIITDPLGRKLGYSKKLGKLNTIPKAFYSGNGKIEQFFIPNPVPGVYTIQMVGLGKKVAGAVASKEQSQGVNTNLALNKTRNMIQNVKMFIGAPGDVTKQPPAKARWV